ncbi:hypothetical protein [Vibrio agarivorans]|uniref:hypothetical protein n=1 Tax=Vibrio agarivorans TaxID=153622 RepID=UPI0025B3A894|nr:hypothetical protein [Vibrio agarivorans]MDN3663139.1 hypothetical protein [Vibrio agarivorans]
MTILAPDFPFAHRVVNESQSRRVLVLASPNLEYKTEFDTVVMPLEDDVSDVNEICSYYRNAQQAVTLVVDTRNDRKNAIAALRGNLFHNRVKVIDIANDEVFPPVGKDRLAYLFRSFELTRNGTFLIYAAREAVKKIPIVYSSSENLVDEYVSDETLRNPMIRAIERRISQIEKMVQQDFVHETEINNEMKVSSLDLLSEQLSQLSTVAVYAATGTGKTEKIISPMAKQASSTNRVVYISNLIALVDQFCDKTGAVSYQNENRKYLREANATAVVINSIWKPHLLCQIYDAEVIIIDEFEKVFKTVVCSENSKTMQADKVFEALCLIIKHAPRVLVADADLTDISLGFLRTLRGDLTLVDCSKNPYLGMQATIQDKNTFLQNPETLKKALLTNKVILFDSLKTLKESVVALGYVNSDGLDCESVAREHGVLVIHADNKEMDAQAAFLANPNDEIGSYNAIIASPCLGAGFSIIKSYTDQVCIVCDGTYIPRELVNFARRFRLASKLLFAVKDVISYSNDGEYIDSDFLAASNDKQRQRQKFEQQKQKLNELLPISLLFTLKKLGFEVACITRDEQQRKSANHDVLKRKREKNRREIIAVTNARDLTSETATSLLMYSQRTSQDLASLERFDIKRFYSLPKVVEKDVVFHRQFDRVLFAHLPFVLSDERLKRQENYSPETQRVASLICSVLFQYYEFNDKKSKLFLNYDERVRLVNALHQNEKILNSYFPDYFKLRRVETPSQATRYLNSLISKLGFEIGRNSPRLQKARISMTHYARMYKAYLVGCNPPLKNGTIYTRVSSSSLS